MAVAGVIGVAEILMMPTFANPVGLQNGMRRTARDLGKTFSESFSKAAQTGLIIGIAAAAKFAHEYEKSLNLVRTLTDTTAGELDTLSKKVKELGASTGVGPDKLVNAMYFIQSAGLEASNGVSKLDKSIQILTQTARLAAIGLGEPKEIAQTLTSVMNAYADSNMRASEASNILVAASKIGKSEITEFGNAIGDVIPQAEQLGVEFDQVANVMAQLTQTGASASEAATQVRALFTTIGQLQRSNISSTQKGALDILGFSPTELFQGIDNDFAATYDKLNARAVELGAVGTKALYDLIPNIRALRGLVGGGEISDSLRDIQNSSAGVGVTYRALLTQQDTFAGKLNAASAIAKTYAINIGQQLLPSLERLGELIAPLALSFFDLASKAASVVGWITSLVASVAEVIKYATTAIPLLGTLGKVLIEVGLAQKIMTAKFAAGLTAGLSNRLLGLIQNSTLYIAVADKMKLALTGIGVHAIGAAQKLGLIDTVGKTVMSSLTGLGVTMLSVGAILGAGLLLYLKKAADEQKRFNETVKVGTQALIDGKTQQQAYEAVLTKTLDTSKLMRKAFEDLGLTSKQLINSATGSMATYDKQIEDIKRRRAEALAQPVTEKDLISGGSTTRHFAIEDQYQAQIDLVEKIRKATTEANKKFVKAVSDSGNMDLVVTFEQIKDALNNAKDPALAWERAAKILGDGTLSAYARTKQLAEIVPVLGKSLDGTAASAREAGSIFETVAKQAKDAADAAFKSTAEQTSTFVDKMEGLIAADQAVKDSEAAVKAAKEALANKDKVTALAVLQEKVDADARVKAKQDAAKRIEEAQLTLDAANLKVATPGSKLGGKLGGAAYQAIRSAKIDATTNYRSDVSRAEIEVRNARLATKDAALEIIKVENSLADRRAEGIRLNDDLAKSTWELTGRQDDIRKALNDVREAQENYAAKQYDIVKADNALADAKFAVTTKLFDVEKAQKAVSDAAYDLNKAQSEQYKIDIDIAKAQQSVADAYLSVEKAQFGVAKAAQDQVSAQIAVKSATDDVINVQREQANSHAEVLSKANALASAQSNLNKVIAETGSNSRDTLNAMNALRDAQLGVKTTTLDVADAQDKLNKARKDLASGVEGRSQAELLREVQRAQLALEKTRNDLTDAKQAVVDKRKDIGLVPQAQAVARAKAQEDVAKAAAALKDQQINASLFGSKIAEAQDKVSKANLGVAEAALKQKEALNDVSKAQLDVTSAAGGVSDAMSKQSDFQKTLADLAWKLYEAQHGVASANDAVRVATNSVADAEQSRIKAAQDLVSASDKIIDTNRAVEESNRAVADQLLVIRDAQESINKFNREEVIALAELPAAREKAKIAVEQQKLAEQGLADVKATLVERQQKILEAEQALTADLKARDVAEKAVSQAKTDAKNLVDQQRLDTMKKEQEQADNRKKLIQDVASAEAAAAKAKMEQDKRRLEMAHMFPGPDGKKMTEIEYYNALIEINKKYVDQLGDKKAIEAFAALVKKGFDGIDPKTLKDSLNNTLKKAGEMGIVLKVTTVIDDKADLAFVVGNNVAVTKPAADMPKASTTEHRWTGGNVIPGVTYEVNERGPEHFWSAVTGKVSAIMGGRHKQQFGQPGYVIPHNPNTFGAQAGGYVDNSSHSYNITTTVQDPELAARQFERQRQRLDRRRR